MAATCSYALISTAYIACLPSLRLALISPPRAGPTSPTRGRRVRHPVGDSRSLFKSRSAALSIETNYTAEMVACELGCHRTTLSRHAARTTAAASASKASRTVRRERRGCVGVSDRFVRLDWLSDALSMCSMYGVPNECVCTPGPPPRLNSCLYVFPAVVRSGSNQHRASFNLLHESQTTTP